MPIPLNSTKEHLSYIINEANVTHLFIGGDKAIRLFNSVSKNHQIKIIDVNSIGTVKGDAISWDNFLDLGEKNNDSDFDISLTNQDMNWTSTIMYTSGSTSDPKGVIFNQTNIVSKDLQEHSHFLILIQDIFLCYLPLFHTFGRYFELMGSIFWGSTYAFAESPSFSSLLKDFKIVSPSVFISIPKRWVQLYELMNENLRPRSRQ